MERWKRRKNAKGRKNQFHLELNHYAWLQSDNPYVDFMCNSMDTVIRIIIFFFFLYSNEINVCHNIGRELPQTSSYCIFLESMGSILSTAFIPFPPPSQSGSHYVV